MNRNSSVHGRSGARLALPILIAGVLVVLTALFWRINASAPAVRAEEGAAHALSVNAEIVADACVSNDPDLPPGACNNNPFWHVGWFTCVELCQGGAYRGLLRADLPALPGDAVIVEAYFAVYTDGNPSSQALSVSLYRITSGWDEDAVEWGSQPSHAASGNLGGVVQPGGGW